MSFGCDNSYSNNKKKQDQDDLSTVKFNSNKNTRGDGVVVPETKQGDRTADADEDLR